MVERSSTISLGRRLWIAAIGLALLLALALAAGLNAEASRASGISAFSMSVSDTQAGGHPDWAMDITFEDRSAGGGVCACEDVEKVDISAPTGLIGNPHAVPRCTLLQYGRHQCPPETQVGIVNPKLGGLPLQIPMYNMEPHPDQAGLVAFETPLINTPVFIDLNARTDGDYGLDSSSGGIFHLIPIHGLEVHLWGVPGSPEHDVSRWPNPQEGLVCIDKPYPEPCGAPVEFSGPIKPLLQNPTSCGEPLTGGLTVTYYDYEVFHADASMDPTTGCDQLSFDPSITVKPTTSQADTASGVDIDLVVPQTQNPTTPTPSQIRAATVILPEGMSVNPNAADGKAVCTDAQGSFGTRNAAGCPEASKVGTVTIDSSALPGPIGGAIYLGESKPGDKYRLFLTGDGYSTHVKLAGSVHMDPQTGRVVTEFKGLPQSPLSEFNMHFFGAERGLLATPDRCGTYSVTSEFVPWDSALADHTSISYFAIDSGPGGSPCPAATRSFTPSFRAGMEDNTAGAHSNFGLKVSRPDGDQNLSGLEVVTPPGFSATLAGLGYCPDSVLATISSPGYPGMAEQTSPACPQSSQVGTVTTEVGAGSRPLHAPGKVYYAGPYHGAPLSLATVIPAVSGPYDLGNVVVRTAIRIDPTTAQVTTTADSLPQIVDGIPLRVRGIQVNLNRPGFALNPTNCAPKAIVASVLGGEGAAASLSSRFQVANCADLAYGPKLSLRLSGGVKRRGHPAVKATFTAKPGEANTKAVTVALPAGELLDNAHIGNVCTRVQFAADACPASSALGTAVVSTPILDAPLKGNVYLRSSSHDLPDLALDLEGQVDFELVGRVDTAKNGALRTSFEGAPDVPVSTLVLDLAGGAKGLLQNSKSLCGGAKKATTTMVGQNGAVVKTKTALQTSCGSKARNKRHSRREARG